LIVTKAFIGYSGGQAGYRNIGAKELLYEYVRSGVGLWIFIFVLLDSKDSHVP
jgi:hypothetical protein